MISFPVRVKDRAKAYTLKLQPKEYPHLIENEHFFMKMAHGCGLAAAETKIVRDSKGQEGLLVTRFDRYFDKVTKSLQKLHQEDACQIVGAYPHDKYRLSAKSICEGIARHASAPIVDIKNFIDLYAFSYIIGNGDLHAKNVSLVECAPAGAFVLSPCYDLVSTLPYGDRRMAVPLGGRDDNFRIEDFVAFGKQFDIPEKAIQRSLGKMAEKAAPWLKRLTEIGLEKKGLTFLTSSIKERLEGIGHK
jgi:serine/threonine-protein kinase HipA